MTMNPVAPADLPAWLLILCLAGLAFGCRALLIVAAFGLRLFLGVLVGVLVVLWWRYRFRREYAEAIPSAPFRGPFWPAPQPADTDESMLPLSDDTMTDLAPVRPYLGRRP